MNEHRREGFKAILKKIKSNSAKDLKLTHREVKGYAVSLLTLAESDAMTPLGLPLCSDRDEITLLLACLAAKGLNHYYRSFIAGEILAIIEKGEAISKNTYTDTPF